MTFDRKQFLQAEKLTHADYEPIVERFNKLYHSHYPIMKFHDKVSIDIDMADLRMIYLALVSAKGTLKEYDPKKGLNQ